MKTDKRNRSPECAATPRHPHILKLILWSLGGLIMLIIAAIIGFYLWLTPPRLAEIIETEAGKHLAAEISLSNPRISLLHSFPLLQFQCDSLRITSKALDSLPTPLVKKLPTDYKTLAKAKTINLEINIISLLKRKLSLKSVNISSPELNLVEATPNAANYLILKEHQHNLPSIKSFSCDSLCLQGPGGIAYVSLPQNLSLDLFLKELNLTEENADGSYYLNLTSNVNLAFKNASLASALPLNINGSIAPDFEKEKIALEGFKIALGPILSNLTLKADISERPVITDFSCSLQDLNPAALLKMIPNPSVLTGFNIPDNRLLQNFLESANLDIIASLLKPYSPAGEAFPSLNLQLKLSGGHMPCNISSNESIDIIYEPATVSLNLEGEKYEKMAVDISPIRLSTPGVECKANIALINPLSSPIVDAEINVDAETRKIMHLLQMEGMNISGKLRSNSHIRFNAEDINSGDYLSLLKNTEVAGNMSISNFRCHPRRGKTDFKAAVIKLGFNSAKGKSAANLNLNAEGIEVATPSMLYRGGNIRISAIAKRRKKGLKPAPATFLSSQLLSDSIALQQLRHSPELLQVTIPHEMRRLMEAVDFDIRVKAENGLLKTPGYPVANHLHALDASLCFDSIQLHKLSVSSQSSALSLNGKISNLRQFLTSREPSLLNAELNIIIDTLQINQIARAYESGVAIVKQVNPMSIPEHNLTFSDSIAALLPRNIHASLNVSANHVRYRNLKLSDLAANIQLDHGNANIEKLTIATPFCSASAKVNYHTGNISNMGLGLDIDLDKIEIVEFFNTFHTLLEMFPQLSNIKGEVGIGLNADIGIFPTMYLNLPGLRADVDIAGEQLLVHQSNFIRHITRMMLIHTDKDLHIKNIKVHADVHDNLLELYPFDFIFDRYHLRMEGLNNFGGDLYYHLGIVESPIHIPFGINIKGTFSDPKLRFGGVTYKTDQVMKITEDILSSPDINMLRELKYYFKIFVQKAAESDDTDNSEYLYSVPKMSTLIRK